MVQYWLAGQTAIIGELNPEDQERGLIEVLPEYTYETGRTFVEIEKLPDGWKPGSRIKVADLGDRFILDMPEDA